MQAKFDALREQLAAMERELGAIARARGQGP